MTFLYSFLNLFQPGILFPALAAYKPMMLASLLAGIAAMSREPDYPRKEVYSHPAFVFVCLYLLVSVISVYYSGFPSVVEMFMTLYQYLIYMVISIMLLSSRENLYRFVWGFLLGGQFIVFYGIYVWYTGTGVTVGGHAAGAYGMYENHNDYTYIVIVIIPFVYMLRTVTQGLVKLALNIFLLTCAVGVMLSLSRGGILALVFEAVLIVLFTFPKKKRFTSLILIAVLGTMVIGYQWAKRSEYSTASYTSEEAESSRLELWKAGQVMFMQNPILGVGAKRFGEYAKEYYDLSGDQKGKNAHNTFIHIIATTGILGFGSFMAFVWYLIKDLRHPPAGVRDPRLDAIRLATLISIYSLLFRALTNAKPFEWSFFILCVVGVTCMVMLRQGAQDPEPEPDPDYEEAPDEADELEWFER